MSTITLPNGVVVKVIECDAFYIPAGNNVGLVPKPGNYSVMGCGGFANYWGPVTPQYDYSYSFNSAADADGYYKVFIWTGKPNSMTVRMAIDNNKSLPSKVTIIGESISAIYSYCTIFCALHFKYKGVEYLICVNSSSMPQDNIATVGSQLWYSHYISLVLNPSDNPYEPGRLLVDPSIPSVDEVQSDAKFQRYCIFMRDETFMDSHNILTNPDAISYFDDINLDDTGNDPYTPGGNSGEGGGTGDFNNNSVAIDFPPLPTLSAVDTGFIKLFNPSLSQLNNLSKYMWSDLFDIDGWRKLFANPMDAILGLSIVPVNVPSAGISEVTVGNIGTGVAMTNALSQYVEVDCGTLNINEYWGAYLDYAPYTKCEVYLPYIGTHAINIDDVMSKTIHIKYHIDILSGSCCAFVKCGESVLYTFSGQCSVQIPITGDSFASMLSGAISIAASIGSMIATGGATAPTALPNMASTAINNLKPDVERSGAIGGMSGMLGIQYPYIIVTRPRQALPTNQNAFMGYPSFINKKLSDIKGYTEIQAVHLENIPASDNELNEIESLLKGGVIF